jgi:hypothetical protein
VGETLEHHAHLRLMPAVGRRPKALAQSAA